MREYPYSHDISSVKTCLTFVIKRFRIFYEYFLGWMLLFENEVSAFSSDKYFFWKLTDDGGGALINSKTSFEAIS